MTPEAFLAYASTPFSLSTILLTVGSSQPLFPSCPSIYNTLSTSLKNSRPDSRFERKRVVNSLLYRPLWCFVRLVNVYSVLEEMDRNSVKANTKTLVTWIKSRIGVYNARIERLLRLGKNVEEAKALYDEMLSRGMESKFANL
ncbi:hypothetical protein Patl1_06017 [Pistacia atlantica]|uniref:Uncharacterized protein n=1 Tax=Pistacia atlantica TaxID=434234 RepID=A0ACC1BPT8_9ROSI|nr:hypothetical protein Patl1_06017 [Pistacia atlantica]